MSEPLSITKLLSAIDDNHTLTLTPDERDVLIAIARTALELSAAGEAFERADVAFRERRDRDRRGLRSIEHRDLELAAIHAERVHLEALAKVKL